MPKHIFRLSDETIKVLSCKTSEEVADEYGCTGQHIRAILGGTETDPFSKLLWLFAACVRAGCDVSPWMIRLESIVAKYDKQQCRSPFVCLAEKIDTDARTTKQIVNSLQDGHISDRESDAILISIRKERKVLDELEAGILQVKEAA